MVSPQSRIVSATSLGVFRRLAPSTSAMMRSTNVSPGSAVTRTTSQSDTSRVPPVTAERSPPASRITGADSPVIADSSTRGDALDHLAVGRDQVARLHDDVVPTPQLGREDRQEVQVVGRIAQPLGAGLEPGASQGVGLCLAHGPRPSPRRSWRTAR